MGGLRIDTNIGLLSTGRSNSKDSDAIISRSHTNSGDVSPTSSVASSIASEDSPFLRDISPDEMLDLEKKLVWKIDLRIIPIIMILYVLNGLDRGSVAAGGVAGLQEELGLSSVQFSTVISIFYVGYVVFQVPSNIFLSRTGRPSLYLPAAAFLWGVICLCQATAHNFGGLLACRITLGFVEAAYYPGCLFLISSWYTSEELAVRTAFFAASSQISGAFSGLLSAGIIHNMEGVLNIRAFRWLFIIEGSMTIFFAVIAYLVLPDFPATTKGWFTEAERDIALSRLAREHAQDDVHDHDSHAFFHGLMLNLRDPNYWLLFLTTFSSAVSIGAFFPSVLKTLGYGPTVTLLLSAPPYMFALVMQMANSWHSDRRKERFLHATWPAVFGVIAYITAVSTLQVAARYIAFILMVISETGLVITWAWASEILQSPPEKRAAALAALNSMNCIFRIWVPYTYLESQAPRYQIAFTVDIVLCCIAITAATVLRARLGRLNKKFDQGELDRDESLPEEASTARALGFRFRL